MEYSTWYLITSSFSSDLWNTLFPGIFYLMGLFSLFFIILINVIYPNHTIFLLPFFVPVLFINITTLLENCDLKPEFKEVIAKEIYGEELEKMKSHSWFTISKKDPLTLIKYATVDSIIMNKGDIISQAKDINWTKETPYFNEFKNNIINNSKEEIIKKETIENMINPLFNDCMDKKDFKIIVNQPNIKNMKLAFNIEQVKCAMQAAKITMDKNSKN